MQEEGYIQLPHAVNPSLNSLWAWNLCAAMKLEFWAVTSTSSWLLKRILPMQGRALSPDLQSTHAASLYFQRENLLPGWIMEDFWAVFIPPLLIVPTDSLGRINIWRVWAGISATRAERVCKGTEKENTDLQWKIYFLLLCISTGRSQLKSPGHSSNYMAQLRQETSYSWKPWNDASIKSSETSAILYSWLSIWGQEILAVKKKGQKGCVGRSRVESTEITSDNFS